VQPKSEESSFFSLSPKFILSARAVLIISAAVDVGLYFGLKALGL
jgi:hypothetical protein